MTERFDPVEIAQKARRWVIKVGTSVLTDERQLQVSRPAVESIASEVGSLWRHGKEAILVTSGAIGVGMGVLELKSRPRDLAKLQAAAATGQGKLMQWYTARLEQEGLHAAQLLLTRGDLEDRRRYLNIKATMETLLRARIVPIINENDTVSTEEIRYGDNDLLSAQVAALVGADLLLILTDVDHLVGPVDPLYLVTQITPELERVARGTSKQSSTGGMRTKLKAARIALASGIPMVVMNGRGRLSLVERLAASQGRSAWEGRSTWFVSPAGISVRRSKRWLAFTATPQGSLGVDQGAREALVGKGRSLLASGVREVEGNFRRGAVVSVRDERGCEFARGRVNYSHAELERIVGLKSDAVEALLGRRAEEVIHRDGLVILRG